MPFDPIPVNPRGSPLGPDDVGASVIIRHAGNDAAATVVVGTNILRRLGWKPGETRVNIAEGSGVDAGMLQFTLASDRTQGGCMVSRAGGMSVETSQGRVVINSKLFRKHVVPNEMHTTVRITWQVFGSTLTVLMPPEWFIVRGLPVEPSPQNIKPTP